MNTQLRRCSFGLTGRVSGSKEEQPSPSCRRYEPEAIRANGDSVRGLGVLPVAGCLVPRGREAGHKPMLKMASSKQTITPWLQTPQNVTLILEKMTAVAPQWAYCIFVLNIQGSLRFFDGSARLFLGELNGSVRRQEIRTSRPHRKPESTAEKEE